MLQVESNHVYNRTKATFRAKNQLLKLAAVEVLQRNGR